MELIYVCFWNEIAIHHSSISISSQALPDTTKVNPIYAIGIISGLFNNMKLKSDAVYLVYWKDFRIRLQLLRDLLDSLKDVGLYFPLLNIPPEGI